MWVTYADAHVQQDWQLMGETQLCFKLLWQRHERVTVRQQQERDSDYALCKCRGTRRASIFHLGRRTICLKALLHQIFPYSLTFGGQNVGKKDALQPFERWKFYVLQVLGSSVKEIYKKVPVLRAKDWGVMEHSQLVNRQIFDVKNAFWTNNSSCVTNSFCPPRTPGRWCNLGRRNI